MSAEEPSDTAVPDTTHEIEAEVEVITDNNGEELIEINENEEPSHEADETDEVQQFINEGDAEEHEDEHTEEHGEDVDYEGDHVENTHEDDMHEDHDDEHRQQPTEPANGPFEDDLAKLEIEYKRRLAEGAEEEHEPEEEEEETPRERDEMDDELDELDEDLSQMSHEKLLELYRRALEERERLHSQSKKQQSKLAEFFKNTKKNTEDVGKEKVLTETEERYAKHVGEHKELRVELNELKQKNEVQINEMKLRLEERQANATELQISYRNFKITMAYSAQGSRTGKPIPKKKIEAFAKLEKEKDDQVRKTRTNYIELKNMKEALDQSIKEKEEFSKGLHLIDFEQLKMENSTLNEKIEEKNESLQKSRLKATTTVHILTHVKEKLQFVQSENLEMQRALGMLEDDLAKHKDILSQIKRERDVLKSENLDMRDQTPLVGNDALLMDYENRKKEIAVLKTRVDSLRNSHASLLLKIKNHELMMKQLGITNGITNTSTQRAQPIRTQFQTLDNVPALQASSQKGKGFLPNIYRDPN
jgi:hypothetical protein